MSTVPLHSDSPTWRFQTWAAFIFSLCATSIAIWWLPVGPWEKGLVGLGLWFTVSSCFALAKSERDQHEAKKLSTKVSEIQTERMLRDMTRDAA